MRRPYNGYEANPRIRVVPRMRDPDDDEITQPYPRVDPARTAFENDDTLPSGITPVTPARWCLGAVDYMSILIVVSALMAFVLDRACSR